jgi:hypothetical protein
MAGTTRSRVVWRRRSHSAAVSRGCLVLSYPGSCLLVRPFARSPARPLAPCVPRAAAVHTVALLFAGAQRYVYTWLRGDAEIGTVLPYRIRRGRSGEREGGVIHWAGGCCRRYILRGP